jgi:hypothetical protein
MSPKSFTVSHFSRLLYGGLMFMPQSKADNNNRYSIHMGWMSPFEKRAHEQRKSGTVPKVEREKIRRRQQRPMPCAGKGRVHWAGFALLSSACRHVIVVLTDPSARVDRAICSNTDVKSELSTCNRWDTGSTNIHLRSRKIPR